MLKRLARKKSQPLFAYKLRLSDFTEDVLSAFNISEEVSHIVVNEDGMKLPVTSNEDEAV